MGKDKHHGNLKMFDYFLPDEQKNHNESFYNKRKITLEITEREIVTLINSIPKVPFFESDEFNTAKSLIHLIDKLQDAWVKGYVPEKSDRDKIKEATDQGMTVEEFEKKNSPKL